MPESTFTLTFAVEMVLDENVVLDDNDNKGWIELGPCNQGVKIQYNLYPGYTYDLDVLIWPNAGKIWCGNKYGWVRTWQFLNKHWMVFTIRHKFPVKVEDFLKFDVIILPSFGVASFGTNAKNDRNFSILIPPLEFGELRYFAKIEENQNEDIIQSIMGLIWNKVIYFIPASYLDGAFDTPLLVTDIRHQDAILGYIRETVLSSNPDFRDVNYSGELSNMKDKIKKVTGDTESSIYKQKLSGEAIVAGSGRINRFVEVGQRSTHQGRVLTVISTNNLPALDDSPVMFVNINRLADIPVDELQKAGFSMIYTRWNVGTLEYNSKMQILTADTTVQFNDHRVLQIEKSIVRDIFNAFMDNCFEIQLRGIRDIKKIQNSFNFFTDVADVMPSLPLNKNDSDVLIACTRIDVRELSKGPNKLISGEFSLYPKQAITQNLKCDCTNYINAIGPLNKSESSFQPYIVLTANMTLEVSIGLLGCRNNFSKCFSRLYSIVKKTKLAHYVLETIDELNQNNLIQERWDNLMTGFALDIGDTLLIYVEGEKNKEILKIWEITESLYPNTIFSSSDTYLERIYPGMISSNRPFDMLKMAVPLSGLLACPPIYVHPALPTPTRTALLKISQIITGKLAKVPTRVEMPTPSELQSFKLELCAPLQSTPIK